MGQNRAFQLTIAPSYCDFPGDPPTVIQNDELLQVSPEARLQILDRAFLRFDDIVSRSKALKIETVAGVYLVAANSA